MRSSKVLEVTVAGSTASLNVALTGVPSATPVAPLTGKITEPFIAESLILPVTVVHVTEPSGRRQSTPEGSIDIQLPKARLLIRGQVDLDVLQTVLAALSSR